MDLISVIIPAYNAEKSIIKCLNSLQNNTYKNLEILVINDGSLDKTQEVVESCMSDERIVLINKENGGVSSARNTGLDVAKGKYITFVDSDDYVSPDYIAHLYEKMTEDVDLVTCRFFYVDGVGNSLENSFEKIENDLMLDAKEIASNYFSYLNKGIINFTCGKLYRSSIISGNRFSTTLKWGEDGSFNVFVFKNCRNICAIRDELYFYVIHKGQTTQKKMKNYAQMMMQHFDDIDNYINFYDGYSQSLSRVGMGLAWLEIFAATVRHCDKFQEYKKNFYFLKSVRWYEYIFEVKDCKRRWKITKRFVQNNRVLLLYLMVKAHEILCRIKRRKR